MYQLRVGSKDETVGVPLRSHAFGRGVDRLLDAIERLYTVSGQSPLAGLADLDGVDDLLVALSEAYSH